MSKITIENVTLEVIGNIIKLDYPSKYELQVNSKKDKGYSYDSNTSSLSNHINQVESQSSEFFNK